MADLKAELTCPICLDIFKDPVTLRCGHNFCRGCIGRALDTQLSMSYMCPQCRKRFRSRPVLNKNTNLNNIAEQFCSAHPGNGDSTVLCNYCDFTFPAIKTCLQCETSMCERHLRNHNRSVQHTLIDPTTLENRKCPIHMKILEYYCTVDNSCICLSCSLAKEHRKHQVQSVNEASENKKERLRKFLETMNSKMEETEKKVQNLQEDMRKIREKADVVTRRVHDRFRAIRRQLEILEETLISDILSRKEESLRSYTDHIQELEKYKEELLKSRRHMEELCNMTDPFSVLQEKQSGGTMDGEKRRQEVHNAGGLDVHLISKTLKMGLYDIMLGLNIWFYIQKPAELVLDVSSTSPNLQVSDDLKTVTHSQTNQNLPETEERFEGNQVLSTMSFSSGRHYWEVQTSDSGHWGVGVCCPSMDWRTDLSSLGCNNKLWCLWRHGGRLVAEHDGHCISLPCRTPCNSVRVYLDYNGGRLSFYQLSDPVRHLYTASASFTEPLHAVFMVKNNWLRIGSRELKTCSHLQ